MRTVAPPALPPPPGPDATIPLPSPVPSPEPDAAPARRRRSWPSPTGRAVITDVAGLGALGLVALSGLGPAYGGVRYLAVGGIGLVLGLGLALVAARRRIPLWALALAVLAVEVLVGACLVQPDPAFTLVLPSAVTVGDMVVGALQGWVNLLTTTVPVGAAQNLLVVPWAAGLAAGATAMSITRRVSSGGWALLALVPLATLLVGGVLMGVDEPAWRLQGTAFTLVALVWGSLRQRSARSAGLARARRPRVLSATVVLAVTGFLGLIVGQSSLVEGPEARYVLRDHVDPPVELRSLPSPLEGFRRYLDEDRRDEVIFTVGGLEEGDLLRLATLDTYDGTIWHVAGGESSSVFQRVGQQLPVAETGERRTVTVEVGDYRDVWLPTLGATERITFSGDRASQLSEGFRYNLATDTGAEPGGLRPGDRYVLDAVVPDPRTDLEVGVADPGVSAPEPVTVEAVGRRLATLSPDASDSPLTRAREVEAHLQGLIDGTADGTGRGYFSDGDLDERSDPPPSRSGHSAGRMRTLLEPGAFMVGNEEQFASAMALLAQEVGLPARVVVGFAAGPRTADFDREVTGADISAWAEVAVDGVGWIPLRPTPRDTVEPPPDIKDRVPPPDRYIPPPPVTVPEVPVPRKGSEVPPGSAECKGGASDDPSCDEDLFLPGWVATAAKIVLPPVLLLAAVTALIAGLKGRRRRRRRWRGPPGARVAGGWADVCDLACDLGDVVPRRVTRREMAVLLDRPGLADLARSADGLVFGAHQVDADTAEAYWTDVDTVRAVMLEPLSPFARWKALVNPRSLRRRHRAQVGMGRRRARPTHQTAATPT